VRQVDKNIHWALCFSDGAVAYDEFGRAEIWESRAAARNRVAHVNGTDEYGAQLHVEKVVVA